MDEFLTNLPSSVYWGIGVITVLQVIILVMIIQSLRKYSRTFSRNELHYKVSEIDISKNCDDLADDLFPNNSSYTIYDSYYEISIVNYKQNSILKSILKSINKYLIACKDSVSDYNIVNDIVERHCDSQEQKIKSLQPFPTYIGLMGTMFGIILGVISLLMSGDINVLTDMSSQSGFDGSGIKALLGGVGVAMVTSFVGLFISIVASIVIRKHLEIVEENKNIFYSWFQTELLPNISNDLSTTFVDLQKNLAAFNKSFHANISDFEQAFSSNVTTIAQTIDDISCVYENQTKLIKDIQEADFPSMLNANLKVVRELEKSTYNINRFSDYLNNINQYIFKVDSLMELLNHHLDRTKAIEDMGVFFKEEWSQVESRKLNIGEAVNEVDSYLKQCFKNLEEFSLTGLESMKSSITSITDEYLLKVDQQRKTLETKSDELEFVVAELRGLANLSSSMDVFQKSVSGQFDKMYEFQMKIEETNSTLKLQMLQDKQEISTVITSNGLVNEKLLIALNSFHKEAAKSVGESIDNTKDHYSKRNNKMVYITLTRDFILIIAALLLIVSIIFSFLKS